MSKRTETDKNDAIQCEVERPSNKGVINNMNGKINFDLYLRIVCVCVCAHFFV